MAFQATQSAIVYEASRNRRIFDQRKVQISLGVGHGE